MLNILPLLLQLIFAAPNIVLNYVNENVQVEVKGRNETMESCATSGLQLVYRYEFELCDKNTLWFDNCKKTRVEQRTIQFDPISDIYKVSVDRFDDDRAPKTIEVGTMEQAFEKVHKVNNMPLIFLAQNDGRFVKSKDLYIDVNTTCTCREKYNRSLAAVTSVLTFGMVELRPYDSGSMRIRLK